ncbi:MAG TPA: nucleoside hydrolase [Terriglobales bacterium]|nr:nucleoside hydrolase [Terriglobales bacterium]
MPVSTRCLRFAVISAALLLSIQTAYPQAGNRRKVIIDQDCRGPATTDHQAILVFVQSPEVETLGITVVSGDQWRDEEVAHTLRMLEIIGRTDIPVVPGAIFPLINNKEEITRWEKLYGKVPYKGAWNERKLGNYTGAWNQDYHGPFVVPTLPEGNPTTKPANEDAAHFLVRMVRQYPHEVTIYAGGPLTNLALAIALDHEFPSLAKELVVMGGSLNPAPEDAEFASNPRREFNFWWDPEATHMVLRAPWPKITVTTVDISIKTRLKKPMIAQIAAANTPAAQYLAKWADEEYMWDELAAAAWLDPSIITKQRKVYLDIDIDHGASYGNTLSWAEGQNPGLGEQLAIVQEDLNKDKFYSMFIDLMKRPTPPARAGR